MTVLSVILHCDLDCFYAQVERERLHLPRDTALAVLQWDSALAVSYPARKFGIKRGATSADIRRLSNNVVTIVPVETIGASQPASSSTQLNATSSSNPHTNSLDPLIVAPPDHPLINPEHTMAQAQAREKVSLARYRTASARVFAAMTSVLSNLTAPILERASIDEAFIDVTREVDRRFQQTRGVMPSISSDTHIAGGSLSEDSHDIRLAHGASIAAEIRRAVLLACNYTVSAGISGNKLMAKLASARNKPDAQTIVPRSAVLDLLRDSPLRKLRGLGGKLGARVENLGVNTAGETAALSKAKLIEALGDRDATYVYHVVRGEDDSQVTTRDLPKSLLAAKSFAAERDLISVEKHWLPILATELAQRLSEDEQAFNRTAASLTVSLRATPVRGDGYSLVSRTLHMPAAGTDGLVEPVTKMALSTLRNVLMKEKIYSFPINFVGLTATNFVERVDEEESIARFFTKSVAGKMRNGVSSEDAGISVVDAKEVHQRRLQEKGDRELALKLHRQESMHGIRKPSKTGTKTGGRGKGGKVKTLDSFFKNKRQGA